MAEPIGTAAGGHPDLNLNAEEKRVYGELLREADPDGFGAVSGDVAVKFFERTGLAPDVLGQIWQIADTENRGFLTPSGFGVVLRLIGHAQAHRVPSASLAPQPAPLPRFDTGVRPQQASIPAPISAQSTGIPSSPTTPGYGPVRVPPLSPEKVSEYSGLFEKSGAENGLLSGLIAKQIFERARLSNDVLGRIWNLADTQGRGMLDVTEFVIAMHLLASSKSGQMRGVPNTLPSGLYDAAARRTPVRMATVSRPTSVPGLQPQYSGYGMSTQSPSMRPQGVPPMSQQPTGDGWLITPADKAKFDQIYATVDRQGLGYVDGEQAVAFFGNARLPEDTLAQIWDLADINSEGRLNRDEFAVAMYLIRQQRGTKDGRGNLPSTLPPALIPPSMRKQAIPPSQPTAPAFDNAPVTQPRSAADDLFGLDVMAPLQPTRITSPTPVAPPQIPQSTGGTEPGPFGSPTSPTVMPAVTSAPSSIFRPFQPTSTFGQSMIPQSVTSPDSNQSRSLSAQPTNEDLLSDNDATISAKLTNETAELGNLSNQVGTLSREMTDLQSKRSQAEQELSQNAIQKQTFESRLSQLRTAFDNEVQEYKALQERLATSRNETKRMQQDIAMIEGSHADMKRQHDQLRTAYETDQQENTNLKEKIRQTNNENETLKVQLEKVKSDSRQQKGMVAINKKQLATNELERDRLQNELKAAQKEVDDAVKEAEEVNRKLEASKKEVEMLKATPKPTMPVQAAITESRALPVTTPPLASPTPSAMSNPFMKREGGAFFSPPIASTEPVHDHSAFDSIFGPSFGSPTTEAPATSFGSETPVSHMVSHEHSGQQELENTTSTIAADVIEPPAPPSGKQITSESLPFRTPLERTESMTSSIKVIPPASRLSPADTPRAMTPGSATPVIDKPHLDLPEAVSHSEQVQPLRQTLPRQDTDATAAGIPGAFPSQTPRSETPVEASKSTGNAVGAGIAAVVAGTGVAAAATYHEDKGKEPAQDVVMSAEANTARANNFDDIFGGPAHQRTPSEQVKDFNNAFASMKSSAATTNGTSKVNHEEFPDIQELDDADDSSEYSEETPLGFDDDFNAKPVTDATSASGVVAPVVSTDASTVLSSKAAGKQPEVATAIPPYLLTQVQQDSPSSTSSSLPSFDQQTSPPTYTDSVPNDNPNQFPREFKGLLPERGDPTSPPLGATGDASGSGPTTTSSAPAYGPEVTKPHPEKSLPGVPAATAKPPAFDFDSAFAGMASAQVEDDDSDDAETSFESRRNQSLDFDPTFDSPTQSRTTTAASLSYSTMSTHDAVTNGAPPDNKTSPAGFYGINNSSISSPPVQSSTNNTVAVSHDWDALFAPLSTAPAVGVNSLEANTTSQKTEISPGFNARTSAAEISGTSTPVPTTVSKPVALPSSSLRIERPMPGRALSAGTEHDDPILKQLTSMGWNRTESLAALERFDYNIDKAADYLTFKS